MSRILGAVQVPEIYLGEKWVKHLYFYQNKDEVTFDFNLHHLRFFCKAYEPR